MMLYYFDAFDILFIKLFCLLLSLPYLYFLRNSELKQGIRGCLDHHLHHFTSTRDCNLLIGFVICEYLPNWLTYGGIQCLEYIYYLYRNTYGITHMESSTIAKRHQVIGIIMLNICVYVSEQKRVYVIELYLCSCTVCLLTY